MPSEADSKRCPGCGAAAHGSFCSQCGSPLTPPTCRNCGALARAGARFCATCGASLGSGAARRARGLPVAPLIVVGVSLAALVGVFIVRGNQRNVSAEGPPPGTAPAGQPPDLSQMTPREAFDRLYNRVMAAAERGDTTTVVQFTPMALQAYRNLDTVDADARYHAAMLRLHTGDVEGAQAQADSILAVQPTHLFGFVLGASIAKFEQDPARERELYRRFLDAWDTEMKAARPEYRDHQRMLDEFREQATAAVRK